MQEDCTLSSSHVVFMAHSTCRTRVQAIKSLSATLSNFQYVLCCGQCKLILNWPDSSTNLNHIISKPTKPIKKTVCFHCGSDSCLSSQQPPCHANRGFYHHIKGHFTWRKVNPVNQAGFPMRDLANLSFTLSIRFAKS